VFFAVWDALPSAHPSLQKVLKTWPGIFPSAALAAIERRLQPSLDPPGPSQQPPPPQTGVQYTGQSQPAQVPFYAQRPAAPVHGAPQGPQFNGIVIQQPAVHGVRRRCLCVFSRSRRAVSAAADERVGRSFAFSNLLFPPAEPECLFHKSFPSRRDDGLVVRVHHVLCCHFALQYPAPVYPQPQLAAPYATPVTAGPFAGTLASNYAPPQPLYAAPQPSQPVYVPPAPLLQQQPLYVAPPAAVPAVAPTAAPTAAPAAVPAAAPTAPAIEGETPPTGDLLATLLCLGLISAPMASAPATPVATEPPKRALTADDLKFDSRKLKVGPLSCNCLLSLAHAFSPVAFACCLCSCESGPVLLDMIRVLSSTTTLGLKGVWQHSPCACPAEWRSAAARGIRQS
jgi:hypothetical protein